MTSSLAERMFLTATAITASQLTEQHLSMLAMHPDTDTLTRCTLGEVSDCLRDSNRDADAVQRCVKAYNNRCGR